MARGSSPQLIGRGAELGRLRDAVRTARAQDRCVVLLSGEAGIGKSRLVAELARSIGDDPPVLPPPAVLIAGCVDIGRSLAYLPVIELLDGARAIGGDVASEAMALRAAFGGTTAALGSDNPAPIGRAASLLRIRDLLARAAENRAVIAVIDDLQWADRSSLEVVSFLARRLVHTGVLLLLCYRSDELGRRHPLRPVLADLERHAALDHVRLEPLSPQDVKAQVSAILGREPDPARLDRVATLADGNPFHVEELLSLNDERRLPPSLHDVLDARLDELGDEARQVVQLAAVIGRHFDPVLLMAVSEATRPEVIKGLRQAIDARILLTDADGRRYRFRHVLLREAVYGDITPVERTNAHRRVAQALTDRPDLGGDSPAVAIADRARHWLAARSEPEAFEALLAAARSAAAANGWPEARAAYEKVLELWEAVGDPEAVAGAARSSILEMAAEIAWNEGDARRALALNRRAQAEPDVAANATRLGRLAQREALLLDDLADLLGEGEAARRAVDLVPAEPPSVDRAVVLSTLGLHALRLGRILQAMTSLEEAIAVSDRIGSATERAVSLAWLATAWTNLGELDRAREAVARLDEMLPAITDHLAWSVVTTWTPWIWIGTANYGRAIEYADRLLADARRRGMDRGVGLWCLAPRALAEFWLGRWEDATATIEQQSDYTWGIDGAVYLRWVAACIAAGRGDPTHARSLAAEAIEIARSGFPEQVIIGWVAAAWVDLLEDQPRAALANIRAAWEQAADWEGLVIRSLVLWIGLWATADLATLEGRRRDGSGARAANDLGSELAAAVTAALASTEDGSGSAAAEGGPRLVLELAAAEAARLHGRDDARVWASIAGRFERLGDLPRAFLARQRQAESILREGGDRGAAESALRTALEHANRMDAARLRGRILALARAARLQLPPGAQEPSSVLPPGEPWGLSKREREVLAMLVEGRTNRQIAEALFISDKTASVHVTHIMNKLGVSRRTEAAILAIRAGMGAVSEAPIPPAPAGTSRGG